MAAPTSCAKKIRKPLPTPSRPHMAGGSASALTLSRPAQASHSLRPTGSLSRPRRPLSRGFSPASYPTKPLVSYRIYRHLSGWILPPLVIRAFGAHCQNRPSRDEELAASKAQCSVCPAFVTQFPYPEASTAIQYRRPPTAKILLLQP